MPNARIEYRKIGDMWERKWALLAWKLDSRGTVIDEVVVLHDVVGGSTSVYRTIQRGEETINIKHNINTERITRQTLS